MKNLIILAFIAVSATMSHAASVTWTMTNVYGPDGNLNSGSAYIVSAHLIHNVEIKRNI